MSNTSTVFPPFQTTGLFVICPANPVPGFMKDIVAHNALLPHNPTSAIMAWQWSRGSTDTIQYISSIIVIESSYII